MSELYDDEIPVTASFVPEDDAPPLVANIPTQTGTVTREQLLELLGVLSASEQAALGITAGAPQRQERFVELYPSGDSEYGHYAGSVYAAASLVLFSLTCNFDGRLRVYGNGGAMERDTPRPYGSPAPADIEQYLYADIIGAAYHLTFFKSLFISLPGTSEPLYVTLTAPGLELGLSQPTAQVFYLPLEPSAVA